MKNVRNTVHIVYAAKDFIGRTIVLSGIFNKEYTVNVYNYKEKTLYSTKFNTRIEALSYYNFLTKKN